MKSNGPCIPVSPAGRLSQTLSGFITAGIVAMFCLFAGTANAQTCEVQCGIAAGQCHTQCGGMNPSCHIACDATRAACVQGCAPTPTPTPTPAPPTPVPPTPPPTCVQQCSILAGQCHQGCGTNQPCHATCTANQSACIQACSPTPIPLPRDARFLSQTVPTTVVAGRSFPVSFTIKNTGSLDWSPVGAICNAFRIGSQNPRDNQTWGRGRVDLPSIVPAGGSITVPTTFTAPATPGTYNFQWQMLQECVTWFGAAAPNVAVIVTSPAPACPAGSAVPSLSAFPASVPSGGSINLSWSGQSAMSCSASSIPSNPQWTGGLLGSTGSKSILNLTATTTFRVDCGGSGGGGCQQVTVPVTP